MAACHWDVKALEGLGRLTEALDPGDLSLCELGAKAFVELVARRGSTPVKVLDLRGADLSLESLLSICSAIVSSALPPNAGWRVSTTRARSQGGQSDSRPEPFWLDIGNNPSLPASEAEKALQDRGIRYCAPVRCSRRRCLYGCALHLSVHVPRQFNPAPKLNATELEPGSGENSLNAQVRPKPPALPPPAAKLSTESSHVPPPALPPPAVKLSIESSLPNGTYAKTISLSRGSHGESVGGAKETKFTGHAKPVVPQGTWFPSGAYPPAPPANALSKPTLALPPEAKKARPTPPSIPPPVMLEPPPVSLGPPPPPLLLAPPQTLARPPEQARAGPPPATTPGPATHKEQGLSPPAARGLPTGAPPVTSGPPSAAPPPIPQASPMAQISTAPPAKSIPSHIPPPPPQQRSSPPACAPASSSPLALMSASVGDWSHMRNGSVYATLARAAGLGGKVMQVAMSEKLDLFSHSQVMMFTNGCIQVQRQDKSEVGWVEAPNLVADPCDARALQLLTGVLLPTACTSPPGAVDQDSADDALQGICEFIDQVVDRLGGNVCDDGRRKCFAESYLAGPQRKSDISFEGLLRSLHDATARSEAGIIMPGDVRICADAV